MKKTYTETLLPPSDLPDGDFSGLKSGRRMGQLKTDHWHILKGLLRNPLSVIGLVLVLIFALLALSAPLIAPPIGADPYTIPRDGYQYEPQPMGSAWMNNAPEIPFWYKAFTGQDQWTHLLGTTEGQYDIFYGIIWGTRTAFKSAFIVVLATFLIGVLIGSLAGYYGGVLDNILMRIVDIFMTLPFIFAALIMAAVLTPLMGRSPFPSILALITFGWMGYARIIRGDVLAIKQRDFVMAARAIGVKDGQILIRYILPNAIFPTLAYATLNVGEVVLSFAALSFLGIGTQVGTADWGQLLSFGRNWIMSLAQYWYIVVWPALALVLFVLAWNLIGDALRDLFDPHTKDQYD